MTDENPTSPPAAEAQPRWQPLGPIDRRVLGVLAEKAKTTPDGYPMSLNAICTGCNQKSNRFPLVQLEPADVDESLERLRGLGAVGMIEGYGRVAKYRHYLYEWLGVDKVELAVMTELLLRGAQTEGELRGRAARMDPIPDLAALRPILQSLQAKGLVMSLTPEGRGHVVTHALYQPRELEHLRAQYSHSHVSAAAGSVPADVGTGATDSLPAGVAAGATGGWPVPGGRTGTMPVPPARAPGEAELIAVIRREIDDLRGQLQQLQSDVHDLATRQHEIDAEVRGLKDALGG